LQGDMLRGFLKLKSAKKILKFVGCFKIPEFLLFF